jgi:hypothetical protein
MSSQDIDSSVVAIEAHQLAGLTSGQIQTGLCPPEHDHYPAKPCGTATR